MEINLTRFMDFPIEKPVDDSDSKLDLTLTLALPHYAELAKASVTSNGDQGENKGKRCSTCGKLDPVTWRKGPDGPKTLCNACGLRHLRNERKASEKREMELMLRTETEEQKNLDLVRTSKRLRKRARRSSSESAN